MQREQVHQLIELAEHLVPEIHKIRIGRLQLFYKVYLQILDTGLDELRDRLLVQILHMGARIPRRHLWSPVFTHIDLDVLVGCLIERLDYVICRRVSRE